MQTFLKRSRSIQRPVMAATLALSFTATAWPAMAQNFPTGPLRIIIPFTAGGTADVVSRGVAVGLGELLGQPVLSENRPGANTIVGAEAVARSAPDGHTMLLSTGSALVVNPAAYKKLPYDAIRDFTAVAKAASNFHLVMARKGFGPNNIPELIKLAKSKPGSVSYGSSGIGSPPHFAGMLLESVTGTQMLHIPYKGISQAVTDLLGENLDIAAMGPSAAIGHMKAGKLKPLIATSDKRLDTAPDVPTMQEIGYAGFTTGSWFVLVARAGTPVPVITRLNRDINAVLQRQAVREKLEAEGFMVDGNLSPAQVTKFIADEYTRWGKTIRDAKIQFD